MKSFKPRNYSIEDKFFYFAIVLSLAAHLLTIFYFSLKKVKILKKRSAPVEVTYQNIKQKEIKKDDVKFRDFKITPKEIEDLRDAKIIDQKIDKPEMNKAVKDVSKLVGSFKLDEKLAAPKDTFDINKKVSIPVFQSEKITNPKYIGYQDSVRSKIHMIVSEHVKDQEVKASYVYLTFSILSNGQLRDVKVNESRSNASDHLKDICIKSIKEASPFSAFPASLNYPELTYNVEIEFKAE